MLAACWAVKNMSSGMDEHKRQFIQQAGCSFIVKALQAFPTDEAVQREGKGAARQLNALPEGRQVRLSSIAAHDAHPTTWCCIQEGVHH
jgi:hypothetical protein